jgi:hypothetical protein
MMGEEVFHPNPHPPRWVGIPRMNGTHNLARAGAAAQHNAVEVSSIIYYIHYILPSHSMQDGCQACPQVINQYCPCLHQKLHLLQSTAINASHRCSHTPPLSELPCL